MEIPAEGVPGDPAWTGPGGIKSKVRELFHELIGVD